MHFKQQKHQQQQQYTTATIIKYHKNSLANICMSGATMKMSTKSVKLQKFSNVHSGLEVLSRFYQNFFWQEGCGNYLCM